MTVLVSRLCWYQRRPPRRHKLPVLPSARRRSASSLPIPPSAGPHSWPAPPAGLPGEGPQSGAPHLPDWLRYSALRLALRSSSSPHPPCSPLALPPRLLLPRRPALHPDQEV